LALYLGVGTMITWLSMITDCYVPQVSFTF